ncbi:MAG TPA: hypothetical protein VM686_04880 [Polyangiaceae bacterium]|jgi:hypothetical protein|nr:hypothetical protein [Polyangiaceae bacterium]
MVSTSSVQRQPRLVLCPYGIAVDRQTVCTSILHHCGGDVSRLIDGPAGEEPFLKHLQRLSGMLAAVRPPLILLTGVTPLMSRVVLLRERFEAELPSLRHADWLLFLDGDAVAFTKDALRLGRLERLSSTAIWHGPARKRYLVVSAQGDDAADLENGMLALAHSTNLTSVAS